MVGTSAAATIATPHAASLVLLGLLSLSSSALAFAPAAAPLRLRGTSAAKHACLLGSRPAVPAARSERASLTGVRMGLFDALKELAMPTEVAPSANSAPEVAAAGTLAFAAGVSEIADPRHPMEDAWFVGETEFGIFDGVSGARKSDNQDGLYSFQLCQMTQRCIQTQKNKRGYVDSGLALEFACSALVDNMACGASTACVNNLDTSVPGYTTLKGVNVGDSGLCLFRRNAQDGKLELVWKTQPQQHFFNCPFQLGGSSPDSPDQAMKYSVPLTAGDILVLGTDGLFDNVYDNQLLDLLEYTKDQDPTSMAQAIVGYARQQQEDPSILVPYGVEAKAAGQVWSGGKLDDTCCVILQFYDPEAYAAAPAEEAVPA
eukprot:CAMPEP_0173391796 /NCGR_PEP_ID=MMETSP1356-20130122/18593_1 /TAXON_ID=77927 ORGANISM="Hemiselmis virescens, Strain PCC157" /NCGR_SAMPLE_ID=MMETSP1356 /ASSEMBLY_ACC=CAM_ASM_000847 /LENGTH=373 /DNA_ID=CAMNT_0014349485 /DNA_START=75 /DNA_END=1196 /DNA_ORIENTATION=+